MNILLLKGYNNYFNRILKTETSLDNYKSASTSYLEYADINFVYNDGVATELVVGGPTQDNNGSSILSWDNLGSPDYLIAWEYVDNVATIRSRWFIMESVKTRKGQYKIALKRDVLADEKDTVMNSPCYIEKGTIKGTYDPLLFNAEGATYNQIKVNETQIKDKSDCAWLVGYLKKNITATDLQNINPINYLPNNTITKIYEEDDLYFSGHIKFITAGGTVENPDVKNYASDSIGGAYLGGGPQRQNWWDPKHREAAVLTMMQSDSRIFGVSLDPYGNLYKDPMFFITLNLAGKAGYCDSAAIRIKGSYNVSVETLKDYIREWADENKGQAAYFGLQTTYRNNYAAKQGLVFGDHLVDITGYNGKYIRHNNKVYKLALSVARDNTATLAVKANEPLLRQFIDTSTENVATATNWGEWNPTTNNYVRMKIMLQYDVLYATAVEVSDEVPELIEFNIPASSQRQTTEDATYDMFAVPVDPSIFGLNGSADLTITSTETIDNVKIEHNINVSACSRNSLNLVVEIMTKLGAADSNGFGYDLQLLPYCPIKELEDNIEDHRVSITNLFTKDFDYSLIKDTGDNDQGIIFWCPTANFSKDITFEKTFLHPVSYRQIVQERTYRFNAVYDGEEVLYITNVSDPIYLEEVLPTNATITKLVVDVNHFADERVLSYDIDNDELALELDSSWLPQGGSSVDLDISVELYYEIIEDIDPVEKKIINETDFVRLTSPNFNSMFEFKLTKLNDGLHYINVDCTYKPYSPYIKLNPDFSFLYGADFNDSTGLILQGDFSLPLISDPFVNYELNNRNYQTIFNREIQNLDVNQRIQREQQMLTAWAGIVGGGIQGAATGFKSTGGSPWGAAVGAAVGAGLGATGGILDYGWLAQSQEEARDFKIDNYNLHLGNVKALPQSMTKATPLSYNNKVWPIFEEFSCTDKEKDLLRLKLTYDGMTINAIGSLTDYAVSGSWVKGRLIRQQGINDDFHVADELYKEVNKGFYLGD